MLPIIATGVGLAGNLWAQYRATKAQKEQNDALNKAISEQELSNKARKTDLEQTFNRDYYQNYLDTESAKAIQKRFADFSKEAIDNAKNSAVSGGATPEAVVATQKSMGDQYNEMLSNLAAKYTDYKTNLQTNRTMQKMGLWSMDDELAARKYGLAAKIAGDKIQSANNLSTNITNAGTGLINAWAEGAFSKDNSNGPGWGF